ncbi:hypothetical protein [Candidatus Methanoperedens nitratireducens]|uniref:Uncharacterized protein n=1 Tax=Candidatus Methanoperedens nitratireducens TaxID=1392998 RepID=A0A284VJW8_9EURY|nr:hypothetical protein [Candidatus Methanoperedens nitroreducens]SNQ59586.1 membrane hypothetical protein [Candidatus Methanoperedens nitroreducens]
MSICIIFLFFLSNISIAVSESLYTLLVENKDLINQNLVTIKKEYPVLFSLIENRRVAIHTPDNQVAGLILSNGEIAQIIQGEPEGTTIDMFVDIGTIENIETPYDFLKAWREARIRVIFRNPIISNPIASGAVLAGSVFVFGLFYYFTGNYYKTKKSLFTAFSMLGMVKRNDRAYVEKEIVTERMLFSILGWEGKGYRPKNNYARLLVGHSYLLNCRFTPLKEFKQAKIKLRYDDTKLKIDDSEHNAELPESKIYRISTKTEGLPEMQTEATDFILICTEWEDGLKEEGLIKIPIVINRNIYDGISYTIGNAIKWLGEIAAAIVIIASAINPLINLIVQRLL